MWDEAAIHAGVPGKGAADGKVGSDALNTTLRAALASQAMFVF